MLKEAQAMGLNTLRAWAFSDGASQPLALQPAPGVLDEQHMRCGINRIVLTLALGLMIQPLSSM